MAYPSSGNTTGTARFVYFNLNNTSSQNNVGPGSGGDNNVFEIYSATAAVNLTGSGIRLGSFQFSQSGDAAAPATGDINFYPRVSAGDPNGGTTGSVWLPIFANDLGGTITDGDWLVMITGSTTSSANVKTIQFFWTGSSTAYTSDAIGGVADLKTLMSQVTNIPTSAGCWSYSSAAQAIRDAVTGSGAIVLRWAPAETIYGGQVAQWYFPVGNQPSLSTGTTSINCGIPGGGVAQGSGTYVCYRARIFPVGGSS